MSEKKQAQKQIIRTHTLTSSPLSPPHHLALRPSRVLATALIAGHGVVMGALPLARPDWLLGCIVLLMPALLVSLRLALGRHALRYAGSAVIGLEVRPDGGVGLLWRDGQRGEAEILGSSTVHPWVVVLNLRITTGAEGRRWSRSVIIVRDACDPAGFRRLRAWLRWGYRDRTGEAMPPS